MSEHCLVLRHVHIGCAIARIALKRGRTRRIRGAAFVAALARERV